MFSYKLSAVYLYKNEGKNVEKIDGGGEWGYFLFIKNENKKCPKFLKIF